MKRQLGTLAIATIAVPVLKFLVFPEAAEFVRFYAASQSILLPVIFVLLVFVLGLLLYAFVRKVGPEQQKRMIDISYWASVAILTIAVASLVVSVKLGIV